jgi:hypothetical protein
LAGHPPEFGGYDETAWMRGGIEREGVKSGESIGWMIQWSFHWWVARIRRLTAA